MFTSRDFMIDLVEFVGLATAFCVGLWAQQKFKSLWAKVLSFFLAVIAGNVVYFVLGVVWAMIWAAGDPDMSRAFAHAIGVNGWDTLGATVVAALVGLFSSILGPFRTKRKPN